MTRRTPPAARRQRDPERTRAKILDAALLEFAEKGYAGARVGEIAERAGVNKQLISYYFGGKEGVRNAINEHWAGTETPRLESQRDGADLAEAVTSYVPRDAHARNLMRVNAWDALAGLSDYPGRDHQTSRLKEGLDYIASRQRKGELAEDLDPKFALLAFMAIAAAPVTHANIARDVLEVDPESEEFLAYFVDQCTRMLGHLADEASSEVNEASETGDTEQNRTGKGNQARS